MISSRQRLAWAGLLASVAFAASAQTATPPAATAPADAATAAPSAQHAPRMRHGDPAQRMEKMKEFQAKRLADLKTKLQLNASQESAWSAFADSRQPPAPPAQRPDRDAFAKMTTPQRLDLMKERQAARTMAFERRADATRSFYAALDPAQQKTFDAETLRMGPRGGAHGGHHGPRGAHGTAAAPAAS